MTDQPTVLVSGATYGIGRGIAVGLARAGWRVVAFGLDTAQPGSASEGGVAGTKSALRDAGLDGDVLEADVSSAADVERVVGHALDTAGRIDGLVNNAAIRPSGTILDTDEATFDRVVAVNLKGMFLTCRAVIPHMQRQGGGAIVNIGSGAGWGKAGILAYCSSKGGVFAFSAALAHDHLADRIRVNVVVPGPQTESGMVEAGRQESEAAGKPLPTYLTATGRQTRPEDIANAVAFLLSEEAAQVSGTILDVGAFSHQGMTGQPRA